MSKSSRRRPSNGRRHLGPLELNGWTITGIAAIVVATLFVGVAAVMSTARTEPETTEVAYDGSLIEALPIALPVSIIGDSYTSGTGIGGLNKLNWTVRVAQRFFAADYPLEYSNKASAGAGYVHRNNGGPVFTEMVDEAVNPDAEVVVIFGSRNDNVEPIGAVRDAAREMYAKVRTIAPNAELIVVGPPWVNENVPADIFAIRDVLAQESAATGATFIDPLALGWFFGDKAPLIGSDGVHPTDQGHAYLEEVMYPRLEPIIAAASGRAKP